VRVEAQTGNYRLVYIAAYILIAALMIALAFYGNDYYRLDGAERPFSWKHAFLRPGGVIGVKLGFLGLAMFFIVFLYPLRRYWTWVSRLITAPQWLNFHVFLGLAAPFVIAFHSAFKFRGFAGIAFWIMLAVLGRYVYAQIPRTLNATTSSLHGVETLQRQLASVVGREQTLNEHDMAMLFALPSPATVARMSLVTAVLYIVGLDLVRPIRLARIRRKSVRGLQKIFSLGGFLPTNQPTLERMIRELRQQASLAKRVIFLTRSEQVFRLWHVIHKPFSYCFATLAVAHIVVVMLMGYR
jgi:hypothetical protein